MFPITSSSATSSRIPIRSRPRSSCSSANANPLADRWDEIVLGSDKLTLVGDPKQSIYRFRRADVAMYDRVRRLVEVSDPLEVKLSANFRSVPPLIEWLNDRFARVLGLPPNGQHFDPSTGRVFQQPLAPGRESDALPPFTSCPSISATVPNILSTSTGKLEGRVLARYLRWLVEVSDIQIVDPLDGRPRRVRYSDIAILAVSTWRLSLLFPWLAAEGIPYPRAERDPLPRGSTPPAVPARSWGNR